MKPDKLIKLIIYGLLPFYLFWYLICILIVGLGMGIKCIGFLLNSARRDAECEWNDYKDYVVGYRLSLIHI